MARIDWSQVDLTRPTDDLMRELGCCERSIQRARAIIGIANEHSKRGGYRKGSGRPKGAMNVNHEDTTGITIRIPESVLYELRELAERRGVSVSKCIRQIVTEYINGHS